MRILLLVHGFNSLAQRLHVDLREAGHRVTVEFDVSDEAVCEAVALAAPDLVLAPFLKRMIPEAVWRRHLCLVVHPGPVGDAGPAALDWAILEGAADWGVTLLQATGTYDAGPVWAHRSFPMRTGTKSNLYRHEVTEAAVACVFEALDRLASGQGPVLAEPLAVRFRPAPTLGARSIDWQRDTTADVLGKVAASDGVPGAPADLAGRRVRLHDAHPAEGLSGEPGTVLATSFGALAVATRDGAVWIGQLRVCGDHPFKLPAARAFAAAGLHETDARNPISYREEGQVGFLRFTGLNGTMGTAACKALLRAYRKALARPTRALVIDGGRDAWSNGLDLNLIEAADNPAEESWRNIEAIDDLAEAILRTDDRLTIAALHGNAGAGGVFLARACDEVWLRDGVILNPHYKDMGNLYGSEFWTYSLPRFAGEAAARTIAAMRLPMGAAEARRLGLADCIVDQRGAGFDHLVAGMAADRAGEGWSARMEAKRSRRAEDEATRPLAEHRKAELDRMRVNFFGFDPSYHIARSNFVRKVPKARTPRSLAHHRDPGHAWLQGAARPSAWRTAS